MDYAESLRAAMRGDGADKPIEIEVGKWGKIYVRSVSADEAEKNAAKDRAAKDAATADGSDGNTKRDFARAAARIICDPDGVRVYDPDSEEDLKLLGSRRWSDLTKVLEAGSELGN